VKNRVRSRWSWQQNLTLKMSDARLFFSRIFRCILERLHRIPQLPKQCAGFRLIAAGKHGVWSNRAPQARTCMLTSSKAHGFRQGSLYCPLFNRDQTRSVGAKPDYRVCMDNSKALPGPARRLGSSAQQSIGASFRRFRLLP
jgi:hypothetical protein